MAIVATPRQRGRSIPLPIQRVLDAVWLRRALRLLGLALAGFVVVAAVFGPDDRLNPTAGLAHVWFWVGLVPISLLLGPVWRQLNPIRTIHHGICAVLKLPPDQGFAAYPARLGYWPAAAGLAVFTWLELVASARTSTKVLLLWFAAYAGIHLLGGLVFGTRWFTRADAFEVYSPLIGHTGAGCEVSSHQGELENP